MSNAFQTSLLPPEGQLAIQSVKDRLAEYVEKMAPGRPISTQDGAFQQRQLWQGVICHLLKQPAQVFIIGWAEFLKVVNENRKGCFSAGYINRFQDDLRLNMSERRNLQRLLHLAYVTADGGTRRLAMKQVDIHQILAGLTDEAQRQKVIAFYEL